MRPTTHRLLTSLTTLALVGCTPGDESSSADQPRRGNERLDNPVSPVRGINQPDGRGQGPPGRDRAPFRTIDGSDNKSVRESALIVVLGTALAFLSGLGLGIASGASRTQRQSLASPRLATPP